MIDLLANKNKILFYFGGFAPVGGIETFCTNLLSHLQSKGYVCSLLCWGKNTYLIGVMQQKSVVITRLFWRWGCQWNLPDWLLLLFGIQLVKRADIVLFNKLFPAQILKILRSCAKQSTKFIYITAYKPSVVDNVTERARASERLNIFDLILVQSQSFIKNLQVIGYEGKIQVIPLIVQNTGVPRPLPVMKFLKIGFLGRLVEDKNIDLLIQSFYFLSKKLLCSDSYPVSLHLFGDGHLDESLESMTNALGISELVTFHGNIPNSRVPDVIASCHLFAFTSINEGQCLAALEILSCGRPLVATDAGALPEILSDSRLGRVVEFTPESIAMGILEVANLLQQNIMTPENICSAYLERFNSQKVGDLYIEIINSLG